MGILCCKARSEDVVESIVPDSKTNKVHPMKFNNKEMPAINVVQPTPEVFRRESLEICTRSVQKPPEVVVNIPNKIIEGRIPGTFPIVTVPVEVPHSMVTPKNSLDSLNSLKYADNAISHKNGDANTNTVKQEDVPKVVDTVKNEGIDNAAFTKEIQVKESDVTEDTLEIATEEALVHCTAEVNVEDIIEEVDIKAEETDMKVEEVIVTVAAVEDMDSVMPDIISENLDPTLSNCSDWSWPSVVKDEKPSPASTGMLGLGVPMSPSRKFSQLEPMALDSPGAKHVNNKFVLIPHQGK